jgi:hypothetical protein
VWGVGRVAKRQEMFFFFDGKGNAKSNRIGTRKTKKEKKRRGSLSSPNGVAKAKEWEESNVCTETLDCAT